MQVRGSAQSPRVWPQGALIEEGWEEVSGFARVRVRVVVVVRMMGVSFIVADESLLRGLNRLQKCHRIKGCQFAVIRDDCRLSQEISGHWLI